MNIKKRKGTEKHKKMRERMNEEGREKKEKG